MITTPHIIRLLGEFMAPERPPTDRHEAHSRATRNALLKMVDAQPKSFQEIAEAHGELSADCVRHHMRVLATMGLVEISKEPVRTTRGNTVQRHLVRRDLND